MNKNLKKVISAVAALALSVSSFVAMASYPDVPADYKYAGAIEELSSMGIIEGFDDGTFKPEELVTRAQMAAIVVRTINYANPEANKGTTKFTDVPEWADAWVSTAAAEGIVNGTNAEGTTFDPDNNVTYAQAAKMLVEACGYGEWAKPEEDAKNWYSGYLSYATSTGIAAGVSGVTADTAVTRGQVAKMVANALEAAICDVVGQDYNYMTNKYVDKYGVRDGVTYTPFKTLLSEKWNAYVVEGKVTETAKSSASTLDIDEVKYAVERSKNYDGGSVAYTSILPVKSTAALAPKTMSAGTTNAADYLNKYTKAIIQIDDYGKNTILHIETSAQSDTLELETNLFDSYDATNKYLYFSKNASSTSTTKYELDSNFKLVVNGVEVTVNQTNVDFFLSKNGNNPNRTVTLTDTPVQGATDGLYDIVSVDYVVNAVVSDVNSRGDDITINFRKVTTIPTAVGIVAANSITIDTTDDTKTYTFTKNGAVINATDLKRNDVVSIKFNVGGDMYDSTFYDVEVSEATASGVVTKESTNVLGQDVYRIDGTDYVKAADLSLSISAGNQYTFYLNANNEVVYVDKLAGSANIAVVDRVYSAASGELKAMIITKNGTLEEYVIATSSINDATINAVKNATGANNAARYTTCTLADRIIEYTITSDNELKVSATAPIKTAIAGEYKAATSRLDSSKIDAATVIVSLSDTDSAVATTVETSLASVDSLVNGSTYAGYAVKANGTAASDAYPFVVITSGFGGYSVDTQMAVISSKSTTSVEGIARYEYELYAGSEELSTVVTEDTTLSFEEGDVIIYTTKNGYMNDARKVLSTATLTSVTSKYDLLKVLAGENAATVANNTNLINANVYSGASFTRDGESVEYYFGPVVASDEGSITLGDVILDTTNAYADKTALVGKKAYVTNIVGEDFVYDSDVAIYSLDLDKKAGDRVSSGNVADSYFAEESATSTSYVDVNGEWINLGLEGEDSTNPSLNTVTFALIRVFDDQVQEVYSIAMPRLDYKATFAE